MTSMLVVCVIDLNSSGLEDRDDQGVTARKSAYEEVKKACKEYGSYITKSNVFNSAILSIVVKKFHLGD